MALSAKLLAAYRKTDYVVFAEPPLVIRVGAPSRELDALLEGEDATSAAYISACNPRSERASDAENEAASAALVASQKEAGYALYRGEGRNPGGGWAERSYLIIGIARADAETLGRAFEQNAIVFCEKGRPAELILLE
jgi:hypothetical protein